MRVGLFRNDLLDECPCGIGGAFQIVPFGGQSTEEKGLANYFLPAGCVNGSIQVREGSRAQGPNTAPDEGLENNKNVDSLHLNIQTVNGTFNSRIKLEPQQSMFGVGINYKQRFSLDSSNYTNWWGAISFPITYVKNKMNLEEHIFDNGGGSDGEIGLSNTRHAANVTEAFRQKNMKYGRIDDRCDMSKWGVADIELKLGYTTISNECCRLNSYVGAVIPTGNKPNARYVFEPIVGNNKHFGLMFGNSLTLCFWEKQCQSLTFNIDTNYRYLFSNHQLRSFDLIDKQWGRYMELYKNKEQALEAERLSEPLRDNIGVFGINELTLCAEVTPRFSCDINTGFIYAYDRPDDTRLLVEAGYNFYASQAEEIQLNRTYIEYNLKAASGEGATTRARTIKSNFSRSVYETANYKPLSLCDIDLSSAAHPSILSSTIYGTIGYEWNKECPRFIGIGGSYEGSNSNAVLQKFQVWGKCGLTF
jgi:hypothetical protein